MAETRSAVDNAAAGSSKSAGQDQDQQDKHNEPERTAGKVTPGGAVLPCGQGTDQQKKKNDNQQVVQYAQGFLEGQGQRRIWQTSETRLGPRGSTPEHGCSGYPVEAAPLRH